MDFILDVGDGSPVPKKGDETSPLRNESQRLIKYFLAAVRNGRVRTGHVCDPLPPVSLDLDWPRIFPPGSPVFSDLTPVVIGSGPVEVVPGLVPAGGM